MLRLQSKGISDSFLRSIYGLLHIGKSPSDWMNHRDQGKKPIFLQAHDFSFSVTGCRGRSSEPSEVAAPGASLQGFAQAALERKPALEVLLRRLWWKN